MADFEIKDDGTIVREQTVVYTPDESKEQALYAEYNRLVYEVMGHPDRFTTAEIEAKKQRMKEIETNGVLLNNNKALKLQMAKIKLQTETRGDNSVLAAAIEKFKKQNG